MRTYLFAFIVLGVLVARAQDATPAAPTTTTAGMTVDEVANLDLTYAPPTRPARD